MGRYLILLIMLFTFTACSSLKKEANKHFENGEYLSASTLYEKVLRKDPTDAEAIERLKVSRRHVLEDRLLEVRQQILSNDLANALEKFESILMDEVQWDVSTSGAAFATQSDEAEDLLKWVAANVHADLQNHKPLKAKVYLQKHSSAFTAGSTAKKFDALQNQVRSFGVADCRTLKADGYGPYSVDFVKKYCLVWGDKDSAKSAAVQQKVQGYGQVVLAGAITDMPPDVISSLSDSLLNGLKTTQYFNAAAPALKVTLSGHFASKYDERQSVGVFSYEVQIPYQEMVTVPYSDRIPYTAYRTEYNATTGQSEQKPYTDYRWETKYRQDVVTKYRTEPRTMAYPETQFNLHYELAGKATFTLDGVSHELPLDDQLELADSYHEIENLSIGLKAKAKVMPTSVSWLSNKFASAGTDLSAKIASAWDNKYCSTPARMNAPGQMESILKCISGTRKVPEFAENWFQSRFGMSFKEVSGVIGLG